MSWGRVALARVCEGGLDGCWAMDGLVAQRPQVYCSRCEYTVCEPCAKRGNSRSVQDEGVARDWWSEMANLVTGVEITSEEWDMGWYGLCPQIKAQMRWHAPREAQTSRKGGWEIRRFCCSKFSRKISRPSSFVRKRHNLK